MKTRSFFILCALVCLTAFGVSALLHEQPQARADDSSHSTDLTLTTTDFGFGEGSQSVAVATIESTDSLDAKAVIKVYVTPSGGSISEVGGTKAERNEDGLWCEVTVPAGAYTSGSIWRAVFKTYSSGGTERFSYARQVTVP